MRLKGFIFDTGTLADTLPLCYAAIMETIYHFTGEKYSTDEVRKLFGPSEEGIFRKIFPDKWKEVLEFYLTYYEKEHNVLGKLFPQIPDMLCKFKEKDFKLAVVRGKGPKSADISLQKMGIKPYIDTVKTGKASGPSKPRAIKEVLLDLNLEPYEAGYVGDIPYDMRASIEAGTFPIGAAWASTSRYQDLVEAGAKIVFISLNDFEKWVLSEQYI